MMLAGTCFSAAMNAGKDYGVAEWTIQNISCWRMELHNEMIRSLEFFGNIHFEIHIETKTSYYDYISVKMIWRSRSKVLGDLSVIGSDGHVFCSDEVDFYNESNINWKFELSPLKFSDVVEYIKEKNDFCKDYIIVRFQMRGASSNVFPMRTVIQTHNFSYIIKYDETVGLFHHQKECITTFKFRSREGMLQSVELYLSKEYVHKHEFLKFDFKLIGQGGSTYILPYMCLINNDEHVFKSEADECLLLSSDNHSFSKLCFNYDDINKEKGSIFLRLRVIPKDEYEFECIDDTIYPSNGTGLAVSTKDTSSPPDSNEFSESSPKSPEAGNSHHCENSLNVLSKDLMYLFQDQVLSDVTLKCDDVTFPVHRVILSARSPVFKTMLSCDMKEAASGQVVITDIDPSTLGLFLTFLYTGALGEEGLQVESALNLYYAADKYQVPSLKRDCADFLSVDVTLSNVCVVLSLADKYQDEELISVVHNFILKNFQEVLSSEAWNGLMKSDPVLVAKTVTQFAQKKLVGKLATQ